MRADRLSGRHLDSIVQLPDGTRGRLNFVQHQFNEVRLMIKIDPVTASREPDGPFFLRPDTEVAVLS